MQKVPPPASPDAYVAGMGDWQRTLVEQLRAAVLSVGGLDEVIKWGHLVYLSGGPALLIRAEGKRVLLGYWRGQRLRDIEPRLKPGGKFEMASISLAEGETLEAEVVLRLTRAAVALNAELGDPTKAAKTTPLAFVRFPRNRQETDHAQDQNRQLHLPGRRHAGARRAG